MLQLYELVPQVNLKYYTKIADIPTTGKCAFSPHAVRDDPRATKSPGFSRSFVPGTLRTFITFIPCSIVLQFGAGTRPFRDIPIYSKGCSASVAARAPAVS